MGTSTLLVPNRIVSHGVVRCRPVFEKAGLNWRKTNPAYAPPSAHLAPFEDKRAPDPLWRGLSRTPFIRSSAGHFQYTTISAADVEGLGRDEVASNLLVQFSRVELTLSHPPAQFGAGTYSKLLIDSGEVRLDRLRTD